MMHPEKSKIVYWIKTANEQKLIRKYSLPFLGLRLRPRKALINQSDEDAGRIVKASCAELGKRLCKNEGVRVYFFGVIAVVTAVETPWMSWIAVFAVVVTIVAQRLRHVWTIEVAEVTPLPKVSARFCARVPNALKRSEKTPLFSFAIVVYVFKWKEKLYLKNSWSFNHTSTTINIT